jgi:hypothetical protein
MLMPIGRIGKTFCCSPDTNSAFGRRTLSIFKGCGFRLKPAQLKSTTTVQSIPPCSRDRFPDRGGFRLHTTAPQRRPPHLSLDINSHLSDKRCSCDSEPFTPSHSKRGDLGQLAPRKKLLKSFRAFLEDFLRSLQAFGTEGFLFGPLPADPKSIQEVRVTLSRARSLPHPFNGELRAPIGREIC